MRPITVSAGPYAAGSTTRFVNAGAPVIGTALTLLTTTLDTPRRVLITAGADAVTTRTMTLVGTDWNGNAVTDVVAIATGAGATVSNIDFKTLTSATPTGTGWSANVSLGTCTTGTNTPMGSSMWARLDSYAHARTALGVDVTSTVNYTVEFSMDDPNLLLPQVVVAPYAMTWLAHPVLTNMVQAQYGEFTSSPLWVRVTVNSGTATSGAVTMTASQAGGMA